MESIQTLREFLKAHGWDERDKTPTDQKKRIPAPAVQKPFPEVAERIGLVAPEDFKVGDISMREAITQRKSRRKFSPGALTLEELSFLLWATQGVHETTGAGTATKRTVPSGGARHPFETYLVVNRVAGLAPGLYRYLALEHSLLFLKTDPELPEKTSHGCRDQAFVGQGAVVFIWTAIPYRGEWRYLMVAHKMIAIDAGHVCQNLYLASEAIGAGTCAIAAYNQDRMDDLVGVDGTEEFVIYAAPVGKI